MNSRFTAPGLARTPQAATDGDLVDVRRLLGIARRQFRAAALCALAGTALGLAYLATATPLYTSTTTLFINPLAGAPLAGAVAPVVAVSLFDSEAGILGSEKIAADAFEAIDPAWLATPASPVARLKRLLRPELQSPEARRQLLLDNMRARLEISRPDAAFLIELAYTSPSPQNAAAILTSILDAYRADRSEKRRSAAAHELATIETRIGDLRLGLAEAAAAAGELRPDKAGSVATLAGLHGKAVAYRAAIEQLLLRQQEVGRLAEIPDDAVRVVSPPRVPVFDSSPNAARAVLLSTLAGAMAGVGLGLLREASERGFRSAGQVRRELGVPCLALLPAQPPGIRDQPFGERAEALRAVKLAIDQVVPGSHPRRIGFAPVAAGDGATTTAQSFAALLAASGAATLLVDADMRRDAADAAPGLSDALKGGTPSPVIEPGSGLAVLPAGTDRPGAAAVIALDAPEVGDALARVAAPFDVIIVDLPPLTRFVDARAMARHLDAIIIVARWRRTERRQLRALLASDRNLGRRLVGVVLNRATMGSVDRFDDLPLDELA